MKKRKMIGLIVLLLIVSTILGIYVNGISFRSFQEREEYAVFKDWMKYLRDDVRVSDVVIPGAHDAGTNTMIHFAKTQYYSIEDQLTIGVRYFDLRIREKDGKYVIYHSIINGVEVEGIFETLRDFLKDSPSEFLILDFQHFDNADAKALEFINTYLKDFVVINDSDLSDLEFVSSLKVGDVRGKCIILFGDNSEYVTLDYIFARNNDEGTNSGCSLDSYYWTKLNAKKSSEYVKEVLPYYISLSKQKQEREGYRGLFVLQSQLTDAAFIFGPYAREKTHDKNMTKYIKDLYESETLDDINIIMRDFLTEEKISDIVRLNRSKNNLNDNYHGEFD